MISTKVKQARTSRLATSQSQPRKRRARAKQPPRRAQSTKLLQEIFTRTRSPEFLNYTREVLLELCRADTTPNTEVGVMRAAEQACFGVLQRELEALALPGATCERPPINPEIQRHPYYSQLHFTKTAARPQGLSAEETYAKRSNLLFKVSGAGAKPGGTTLAINGHIDVVAPYIPPRTAGGSVFGRGACDDKGPVVSAVAALKVLAQTLADAGLRLNRNLVLMLVVEEETGGNGSLSLALDRSLKAYYDSLLVLECTSLKFHPANRGAVWYRAELRPGAGLSNLELFAFVNEELEKEGAAIRAESRHALFPQRPVQTCHGILGQFGEHPSRICGYARFRIEGAQPFSQQTETLVRDCLEVGLAGYIGLYGDKTKELDADGQPVVNRHLDIIRTSTGLRVEVHGATGHMGAIRERDGALTKLAHLVRSLVYSREKIEAAVGGPATLILDGTAPDAPVVLEGGQGFVPTHSMEEVMKRLCQAAQRGAENYLRRSGQPGAGEGTVRVTFEKLHNEAFAGDPDSPTVRQALEAARLCHLPQDEPILGWTVSCDARLFAAEYPGMPVLTFGPGHLKWAHSDQEQIALDDIRKAAEFLAVFILRQTGTIE